VKPAGAYIEPQLDRPEGVSVNDCQVLAGISFGKHAQMRGIHRSTAELEADIHAFIEHHNANPKPYRWTKSADEILAAVKRFCQKTEQTLCAEL
jgi:hypothetical protein